MASTDILQPIYRTYQRRGYLSTQGLAQLDSVLAECATLYNAAIQERRDAWRMHGKQIYFKPQDAQLKDIRRDLLEWGGLAYEVGRGVLRKAERAYDGFFRRIKAGQTPGYPRFKSHHRWHSIELPEVTPSMVKAGKVKVKGFPAITIKQGGLPDSCQLKTLRITRKGRRLTVNFTYVEESPILQPNDRVVGIDMGVSDRMALSDGQAFDRRIVDQDDLAEMQRRLASCRKGSREWRKRKPILANAQGKERVRNQNQCHRITTGIVRHYRHFAVEDLQITNMTVSAKGTVVQPGTNVRAKSGLNREIMTQTWGILREQLRFKAEWAGREYVAVPARNTSQRCSVCGVIGSANRTDKTYHCGSCGSRGDADVNAARNIAVRAFGGWEFPAAGQPSSIEAA